MRIGADPLGGAAVDHWGRSPSGTGSASPSSTRSHPTWRFMTLDWDGKIRMDCSPSAMASLIDKRETYQIATGTTPTPTGTASSPRRVRPDEPQPLSLRGDQYSMAGPAWKAGGRRLHRQDPRVQFDDRPHRRRIWGVASSRCRSAEVVRPRAVDGPGRSVARSPPAPRSALRRSGCGTTDRDGIILRCSRPRSLAKTGKSPERPVCRVDGGLQEPGIRPTDAPPIAIRRRSSAPSPPTSPPKPLPARRSRRSHRSARQRRQDRWPQVVTESAWFAARPSGPRTSTRSMPSPSRAPAPRPGPGRGQGRRQRPWASDRSHATPVFDDRRRGVVGGADRSEQRPGVSGSWPGRRLVRLCATAGLVVTRSRIQSRR